MKNTTPKTSALDRYHDIIERYHQGEFGSKPLHLNEILEAGGDPDLLETMTFHEISQLIAETSNLHYKMSLSELRKSKIEEPNKIEPQDVIRMLDKMKEHTPAQVVVMETPEGTLSLKLKDANIYEGGYGEIVLDSE